MGEVHRCNVRPILPKCYNVIPRGTGRGLKLGITSPKF